MLAFFRNDMGFGGNNGFTDFKELLGVDLQRDSTRVILVVITVAALAASYWACRFIVASRAGRVLRAIATRRAVRGSSATASSRSSCGSSCFPRSSPGGWCVVCSAGRHHQPQRVRAHQLDRGGDLGCGRRARNAHGAVAGAVLVNYAKTFFTGTFPKCGSMRSARSSCSPPVPAARHHRRAAAAPGGEMNAGLTATLNVPVDAGAWGDNTGGRRAARAASSSGRFCIWNTSRSVSTDSRR